MRGIILAAGKGERLNQSLPKSLQSIGGRTILARQLNALERIGVKEIVCVIGYQREKVSKAAREYWPHQVFFVENPKYETTNTSYSLYLARDYMDKDFIYMNGDVVFRPDLLDQLIHGDGGGRLAIVTKPCGDEEVKVKVEGTCITGIGKKLNPEDCLGEFIGVALFRKSVLGSFKEALRELIEERGLANEYFEAALAQIVNEVSLMAVDASNIPCIEIDFPEDLKQAQVDSRDFDETN